MKVLSLIPKKVQKTYQIKKWETNLSINHPCYVNIEFDKYFKITKTETEIRIQNYKCAVTLYLKTLYVHITIYKS